MPPGLIHLSLVYLMSPPALNIPDMQHIKEYCKDILRLKSFEFGAIYLMYLNFSASSDFNNVLYLSDDVLLYTRTNHHVHMLFKTHMCIHTHRNVA